ncbi:hypothetical protein INT47_006144 [Mucor saturninus]|uniref:Telomerase reverse transcriptase n=1 Tax=Mucor saturninus TaxID=64648 RepID=A0A8H7REM1_9FUNG|nr:hypothetical protein INT47_006144 [Mucor saturninus]
MGDPSSMRLPNNSFYQLSGHYISTRHYSASKFTKLDRTDDRPVNNQESTFLSQMSQLAKDADSIPPSLQKRKITTDDNSQPIKAAKLSRGAKKRIRKKELKEELKSQKKIPKVKGKDTKKPKSLGFNIRRHRMFYADAIIDNKTDKAIMTSNQIIKKDQNIDVLSVIFPLEYENDKKKKKFLKRFIKVPELIQSIKRRHNNSSLTHLFNSTCPMKNNDANPGNAHIPIQQINDCMWLKSSNMNSKCSPSDLKRKEAILNQALYWLFDGYIISLIKSLFYVTENATCGKKVFFYRQDVWRDITRLKIRTIIKDDYAEQNEDVLRSLSLGIARIRLIPKNNGCRVITKMSKTMAHNYQFKDQKFIFTKKVLLPVLNILSLEKLLQNRDPKILGSSVMGKDTFYRRYREYKAKQRIPGEKFYFVKIDIASCFDNIDQEKLLSIMKSFLHEEYIERDTIVLTHHRKSVYSKKYTLTARKDETKYLGSEEFLETSPESIIVDQDSFRTVNVQKVINLLEESITKSAVKIGEQYYSRTKGISQGSSLSTLLCSFFLARFEKDRLSFLAKDPDGVLFTYVDDFLYITKSLKFATWFRQALIHEIRMFGLRVNTDKCVSNIDDPIEEFSWLGYVFNTENLDVHLNLPNFINSDVESMVTTEYSKHPGKALLRSCVSAIKGQYHDILMNSSMNSKQAIVRNLYELLYIAALKTEAHSRRLCGSIIGFINESFLIGMCDRFNTPILFINLRFRYCFEDWTADNSNATIDDHTRRKTTIP